MGEKLQKFQVVTAKRFQKLSRKSSSDEDSVKQEGTPSPPPQRQPQQGDARNSGTALRGEDIGTATVAETTLTSAAVRGSFKLEVASTLGFAIGCIVRIGSEVYEERMIVSFGSLGLDRPTLLDHPTGTPVVQTTRVRSRIPILERRSTEQFDIHSDGDDDDGSTLSKSAVGRKFEYRP